MSDNKATNLYIGLELGNRTSVMAAQISGQTKQNVVIQPSVYRKFSQNVFEESPGIGSVEHGGEWFQVGNSADGKPHSLAFTSMDKYKNADGMRIVFKSLLRQILPRKKSNIYSAHIGFGVPAGWQTNETIKAIKDALSGTHRINSGYDHGRVLVNPKNITIYHEPVGAYAYHSFANNAGPVDDMHVLDIGMISSDLLAVSNGALDTDQTATIDYGMTRLYAKLQNHFQPIDKRRKPIQHWEQFARSYRSNSKTGAIDSIIIEFVMELKNAITSVWSGLSNKPNLMLVGGGGAFIAPYFEQAGLEFVPIKNHQTINAHGLLCIVANSNAL